MAEAAGAKLPPLPWHVANVWWDLAGPLKRFTSLEVDVTIDRDVPDEYNPCISPCGIADGENCVAEVGPIFKRDDAKRRHDLALAGLRARTVTKISAGGCAVFVDTNDAPDLKDWGAKAGTLCVEWLPRIAALLPSDGFVAPKEVTLCFDPKMKGVAHASGGKITISASFVRQHPDDWGMVIHELTHAVQSYPPGGPGWLVEGIADYIRIVKYEPQAPRPAINRLKASYKDAYKTAAMFLEWIETQGHPGLVAKLNAALRMGQYTDEIWSKTTSRPVDEWWAQFAASRSPAGAPPK